MWLFGVGMSAVDNFHLSMQTCYNSIISISSSSSNLRNKHKQDSIAIAKKTARCAQYMGALKSFESPHYAPGYFSRNF